jgi:hypothetical protein
MAGSGRKVWAADEILAAADLQDYVQDQVVFVYANSTARASGILAPSEGMVSYLNDTNLLYTFDGSNWVEVAPNVGTAGTYTKVTTDAKGRVTSGTTLSASDVPDLDSAKITSGTLGIDRIPTIPSSQLGTGNWNMGAATLTTINVTASGVVSAGDFSSAGTLTANGGITSTAVYNQTNTGRAMFVASNGLFGIGSSSERFKENIKTAVIDVDAVLDVQVRNFTYKPDFSDDQSVQVGVIAEELVELGLSEFVFFDADGNADGVAYEKLALALLPVIQVQQAQLDSFEERLSRLEK